VRGDGVSNDLVGVAVLDRTQIQLALTGGMLGDIGQSLGILCGGGEVAAGELVGAEPVSVGRVVGMDGERGVDQARVIPGPLRDWGSAPLVVGLPGDPQHPARHRDRHPHRGAGRGQFTDERERYFPGRLPCAR